MIKQRSIIYKKCLHSAMLSIFKGLTQKLMAPDAFFHGWLKVAQTTLGPHTLLLLEQCQTVFMKWTWIVEYHKMMHIYNYTCMCVDKLDIYIYSTFHPHALCLYILLYVYIYIYIYALISTSSHVHHIHHILLYVYIYIYMLLYPPVHMFIIYITLHHSLLTHWGRVTHICVGTLFIIESDNGLSPGWRQAIILTNAGILSIGPLVTNFSEILFRIQMFSINEMELKMSSAKWRPFCLGLNESI